MEKDGRIGLRRDHSGDSVSVSSRRLSNETGTTTPQPVSEKSDVFADNMAKNTAAFKSNLSPEPVPQPPKQEIQTPTKKGGEKSSENLAPNPNPDKITDEEEPSAKLKPGLPTDKEAIEGDQHISDGIGDILKSPPTTTNKAKAPVSKPAPPKPAPKPAHIPTTTKAVPKATKSPTTATAAKAHTKEPAKTASSASEKKPTTATAATSKDHAATKKTTVPAKSTAPVSKKPAPVHLPPSGTGFVKPKPKSPTRPLHLPPSLTTHTAASASKVGNGAAAPAPGRQSNSRASGNAQHLNVHPASHRPSSRSSASTTGTATGSKGLKRQNSNVSRPRPSLGPPPKPAAKDHPPSKKDSHVDEGFLARMMRPTQSSQSKTAEKVPVTPPRRHKSPTTTHPKRSLPAKDVEGSAKKAAAKIQASGKPKAATGATKATAEQPKTTAKDVAPVVAKTETAEEAIETAKASKETASTPLVEKAEMDVAIEPTAEAVAPVTAQAETAEAAIEAAKVSTDTAATPLVEKTEPEVVVEALKVDTADNDKSASSATALTVEPEKVEDIEDLVHVSKESPVGSDTAAAPAAEMPTTTDEDVKEEDTKAAVEEKSEEVEA